MAGSVNKVILVGRCCADPEVRSMGNGGQVVNLTIATSETWKDKNTGERKEKTEFSRVVIFNEQLGKIAQNYLKKGSTVYLEGSLQTRKWTDNNGVEKYSTEICLQRYRGELTMLGGKSDSQAQSQQNPTGDSMSTSDHQQAYNMQKPSGGFGGLDDDVPEF